MSPLVSSDAIVTSDMRVLRRSLVVMALDGHHGGCVVIGAGCLDGWAGLVQFQWISVDTAKYCKRTYADQTV